MSAGGLGWTSRTAIVTGASSGIGRAVALALSGAGASLALLGRDTGRLTETADGCARLAAPGAAILALPADVTDTDAATAAVRTALRTFGGRLDLLANVAGSALRSVRLEQTSDVDWRDSFDLHVLSVARLQRLCFDALRTAGGSIVSVSSIAAERAAPVGSAYAAAKAALNALTRATALEWGPPGIRANVVEPGFVDTPFNDPVVAAGLVDRVLARVPTGRSIRAEAIADAVLFLGDPTGVDVNGSVLRVDGGWGARL